MSNSVVNPCVIPFVVVVTAILCVCLISIVDQLYIGCQLTQCHSWVTEPVLRY